MHEIAGLGELKSPWHECQMAWLENHLNIINTYSQALEALDNYKGNIFPTFFFLPKGSLEMRLHKYIPRVLGPFLYFMNIPFLPYNFI